MKRPIYSVTVHDTHLNDFAKAFEFNRIKTRTLGRVGNHQTQLAVYPANDFEELQFWRITHAQHQSVEDGVLQEKS